MSFLKADGFDAAIIGIDMRSERIIYDKNIMVKILLEEGMDVDDAIEHLEYNVFDAWVGDHTPIYMDVMDLQSLLQIIDNNES